MSSMMPIRRAPVQRRLVSFAGLATLIFCVGAHRALGATQCPSAPCGDGSDGAYAPTISGNFDPRAFHGTGVGNNVFNFTTVTIPKGVTIAFTANLDNAPVYWLATGKVDIEGTLNLAGAPGAPSTSDAGVRVPAPAGSGGYAGGVGGNSSQQPTAGSGPAGGQADPGNCFAKNAGNFTGNQYLIPLVGGSGGGGAYPGSGTWGVGGGGGGGAILIASSVQIIVNGTIIANGGPGPAEHCYSGAGGGGAIRLVSQTISGTTGTVTAAGGPGLSPAPPGRARLEANTISSSISFTDPITGQVTPVDEGPPTIPLFIPTAPQASVRVTSINGKTITENPFIFPDITINSNQAVPVVITGHQVPIGTVPTLVILGETADQDLTCTAGLQGTLATSTCTINIQFNYGGSHGLVKAKWPVSP